MSSSPRIFVTGVSGYIGGHTVVDIMLRHPEWHVVVLVRNEEQKAVVLVRWPNIEVIIGDLDNKVLLVEEGSKADVVLRKLYGQDQFRESMLMLTRNGICRPCSRRTCTDGRPQPEETVARILRPCRRNRNTSRPFRRIW